MSELNLQNRQLEELEPIDPGITLIDCTGNRLETLPDLPPGLLVLNCSHNPLNELPTLPPSIQSLDCSRTFVRSIPLQPTLLNLTRIHCETCDLVEMPLLPPNVRELNCSDNPMSLFEEPLPNGLQILICSRCYLDTLPVLPNSLMHLECIDSGVRELPTLPTALTDLFCQNNFLRELPELPNTLVDLECQHNEIEELPTLPNGIETVNCSFNHIQNLPVLPASLFSVICIHNPLSRESFDIMRETFPFQEYREEDYPEGFGDPTVDEADTVEPPVAHAELTEGDRIEARNIAVQQEVHEAFDKIDISKLYTVIDSPDTPPYHPDFLFDYFRQLVHSNTLEPQERARIIGLFEQFTENIRDAFYTCSNSDTKKLITTVIAYVSRQGREFKNNYVRFLIDDISSAYEYNPEIPDLDTVSCTKGIKERIVMSLKSATLGQTEAYQPLLRAFIHKIPIDIMREFTSTCMKDPRVKEMLEANPEPSIDVKVRTLASCIREKLHNTEYFPPSGGAEEVRDPPEFTEYIATLRYGFEGGKKTRKFKKSKTKRKFKKSIRKIKKSKLSKKRNK